MHRLPRCWVAYEAPPEAPEPNRRQTDRPVTFASFNDSTKISTDVVAVWAEILHNVPESTLRLQAKQFDTPEIRQYFQRQLQSFDVSAERVQFFGHTTLSEYYGAYHDVDVVLDPFRERVEQPSPMPCGWGTCRWSDRQSIRQSNSGLQTDRAGTRRMATSTISEYVEMAVRLGGDPRYKMSCDSTDLACGPAHCAMVEDWHAPSKTRTEMQEKAKTSQRRTDRRTICGKPFSAPTQCSLHFPGQCQRSPAPTVVHLETNVSMPLRSHFHN